MRRITILMTFIALVSCAVKPPFETTVFEAKKDGYDSWRIPALVTAPDGTLLAFAEARKDGHGDAGNIDLVLKRSTDGGKTWGPIEMVWDDGGNTCGNPAPVFIENGRLVMLMTWNLGADLEKMINTYQSEDTRRVFLTYSDDIGKTWSTPVEITSDVKDSTWSWYATGPCHAIYKRLDPAKGRIIVPCNHNDTTGMSNSHIVYSDDQGATWKLGGIAPAGGNESTIAELSDGSLIYNQRKWHKLDTTTVRRQSYSNDGGITWSENRPSADLIEPVCQGSIMNYMKDGRPGDVLLFSNPHTRKGRRNMTICKSTDGGKTWKAQLCVNPGKSAYSDMTQLSDGNIGLLYEYGSDSLMYAGIRYRLVTKQELDL